MPWRWVPGWPTRGPQPTPGGPNGGPATPKILSVSVSPPIPSDADSLTVQAAAGCLVRAGVRVLREQFLVRRNRIALRVEMAMRGWVYGRIT